MVSQRPRRSAAASRARLLAAATEEFAARGFDGAKVDRIAARARVNKAMLYYHFKNKAALYREILQDVFRAAADAVEAVRRSDAPPERQLCGFIEAVTATAMARPHFPVIWLREIAEAGRHLDDAIVGQMRRVMQTLSEILVTGREAGVFREVNPFVAQMGIVAPLLFFAATAPVRERYGHKAPYPIASVPHEAMVDYVQTATLASLAPPDRRRTIRNLPRRPRS